MDGPEVDDDALFGHAGGFIGDFVPIAADGGEVRQPVKLGVGCSRCGVYVRAAHQL